MRVAKALTGVVALVALTLSVFMVGLTGQAEAHSPAVSTYRCPYPALNPPVLMRQYIMKHMVGKHFPDRPHWLCYYRHQVHLLWNTWRYPDSVLPYQLRLIRGCESLGQPTAKRANYKAQNPHSTASGGYQYLDSTWGNHEGYTKAKYAPPWVQDRRALRDYRSSNSPWTQSASCWS